MYKGLLTHNSPYSEFVELTLVYEDDATWEFSYDSNGNITEIEYKGAGNDKWQCSITYDPMTIICECYYYGDITDTTTFSNITTNDNGYITGFTASGTDTGDMCDFEETATFTYDGNRLTNATYNTVYSEDDLTYTRIGDVTFTWDSKGALTRVH